MKTIQKEITVTRYVAEDGSEFENQVQCKEYELECIARGILMYDSSLNPVPYRDSTYLFIRNHNELAALKVYCKRYHYKCDGVDHPGLFIFHKGDWVALSNFSKLAAIYSRVTEE